MWAAGILITICSWVKLYLVFKAVGGDQVSSIINLSLGVVVVLAVLVAGDYFKKRF